MMSNTGCLAAPQTAQLTDWFLVQLAEVLVLVMWLTRGGETSVWPQHDQKVLWSLSKHLTIRATSSCKPPNQHPLYHSFLNILYPAKRKDNHTKDLLISLTHSQSFHSKRPFCKVCYFWFLIMIHTNGRTRRNLRVHFMGSTDPGGKKKKRETDGKFEQIILVWENVVFKDGWGGGGGGVDKKRHFWMRDSRIPVIVIQAKDSKASDMGRRNCM